MRKISVIFDKRNTYKCKYNVDVTHTDIDKTFEGLTRYSASITSINSTQEKGEQI